MNLNKPRRDPPYIPDHLDWKPLGEEIGSGGQGTVHLVYHKDDPDKTPRALKVLNKDASHEAQKRFQNEIKTVRNISHHNIIKVLDNSPQSAEFQFLVMKYHKGAKTIEEVCLSPTNTNPFHGDTLKCLDLFEQIILAVQACELSPDPIYHRDISPRNILMLPDDSIRLIDFGLCHTVGDSTITMTGENLGTRSYAPPECGAGSEFEIGTHTDIYSAAKVLWSVITSERAFDREDPILKRKSMQYMFYRTEETWHLDQLFESTIQYNPNERLRKTEKVLYLVDDIRHAVSNGFPPLASVSSRCPSCGRKSVHASELGLQTFGGHMSNKLFAHECSACGFVFARRHETLDNSLKKFIF